MLDVDSLVTLPNSKQHLFNLRSTLERVTPSANKASARFRVLMTRNTLRLILIGGVITRMNTGLARVPLCNPLSHPTWNNNRRRSPLNFLTVPTMGKVSKTTLVSSSNRTLRVGNDH